MLDRVMFQQQRGWLRELVRGQDVIIQKNNQTGLAGMEEAVHIPYHTDTHTHTHRQTDTHKGLVDEPMSRAVSVCFRCSCNHGMVKARRWQQYLNEMSGSASCFILVSFTSGFTWEFFGR